MAKYNYLDHFYVENVEVFKIKHDVNGNPRYVIHFLDCFTKEELNEMHNNKVGIQDQYSIAVEKSKGSKYRAAWFGGGIVLQSYNIEQTIKDMFK